MIPLLQMKTADTAHTGIFDGVSLISEPHTSIGVGTGGGGTGGMCPPKFHKLLYKLLTTLCVVSDCAPPIKVFPTLTRVGQVCACMHPLLY